MVTLGVADADLCVGAGVFVRVGTASADTALFVGAGVCVLVGAAPGKDTAELDKDGNGV